MTTSNDNQERMAGLHSSKCPQRLNEVIGQGKFGVVRVCENILTGQRLACKSISKLKLKTASDIASIKCEISALKKLNGHKHIVSIHDVYEDSNNVHILMSLHLAGDLLTYYGAKSRIPEKEVSVIFGQIALAVEHCHKNGIIHRDLKPENILFESTPSSDGSGSYCVKLIDFGLSAVCTPPQKVTGAVGSPSYVAPEVIDDKPYGFEADIWSMGVILYAMLSGELPFWSEDVEELLEAICSGRIDLEARSWKCVSSQAKSLVKKMLTVNPKKRATITQVLNHPWLIEHSAQRQIPTRSKILDNPFRNFPSRRTSESTFASTSSWRPFSVLQSMSWLKGNGQKPSSLKKNLTSSNMTASKTAIKGPLKSNFIRTASEPLASPLYNKEMPRVVSISSSMTVQHSCQLKAINPDPS